MRWSWRVTKGQAGMMLICAAFGATPLVIDVGPEPIPMTVAREQAAIGAAVRGQLATLTPTDVFSIAARVALAGFP